MLAPSAPTYSHWLRKAIAHAQAGQGLLVSLFESSVTEPVDLLAPLVASSFAEPVTTRYESAFSNGNPFVVQALARQYGVGEKQIVSTTGATGALSLIYRALLRPGDRVLVENPGFDLFGIIAECSNFAVDRFERTGPHFAIDPDAVEQAIRPETRIVVVSNLHNPSGFAIPEDTLRALGAMAERRDVTIIVDEVYAPYAGPALRPAVATGFSPRLLSVNSLTKIYGLSTLRCGWIVGDEAVMKPIRDLSLEVEFSISKLSHAVAALVLEAPEPYLARTAAIIAKARPVIESYHQYWHDEGLVEGELPEYGCIAFPRLRGIDDTKHFSEWLAQRGGVVVAPGEYFGTPGHVRIGFGMEPARLDYGLQALTDGMTAYRELQTSRKKESC